MTPERASAEQLGQGRIGDDCTRRLKFDQIPSRPRKEKRKKERKTKTPQSRALDVRLPDVDAVMLWKRRVDPLETLSVQVEGTGWDEG